MEMLACFHFIMAVRASDYSFYNTLDYSIKNKKTETMKKIMSQQVTKFSGFQLCYKPLTIKRFSLLLRCYGHFIKLNKISVTNI